MEIRLLDGKMSDKIEVSDLCIASLVLEDDFYVGLQ